MKVGLIMGSDSDFPVMKKAIAIFKEFGVEYEVLLASAHRTPAAVREFVSTAEERGISAFVVGAGMAAHLPGVVDSYTTLPVIGVPLESGSLQGMDALLARYGMTREGHLYRCDNNQPDTIVLFCHFGIMMACIGHLLGVSPMLLWHGFCTQPSSVTTLVTEERVKGEVVFRCMQSGDLSHLYAADEPYSTAALFPECYTGRDSTDPPEWDTLGYR